MAPKTQTAVIITQSPGSNGAAASLLPLAISHSVPVPQLPSQYHVLVRVLAVALNPNDHKMAVHFPMPGITAGCDFCGVVDEDPPSDAGHSLHPPGTRVCGAEFPYRPNAGDSGGGAFAQYIAVDSRLLVRVPAGWSDLQGAALGGVGWSTLSMAFSDPDALGLVGVPSKPLDTERREPVLVYGGATATGTLACQLLKASGYDPIAVTSPASAPLALKYGAIGTASYTSAKCGEQIRALAARKPIRYALDCITDGESAAMCFGALGRAGGRYACLEDFREAWRTRRAVRVKEVMGFEVLGVDVNLGPGTTYTRSASEKLHSIGVVWAAEMQHLLDKGGLRTHPVREVDGQWEGILEGLGRLQRGGVRGEKLVVRLSAE